MELSVVIAIIVMVVFVYLYINKRRKERQMGNDLESLIDANDWQGVCHILTKQLILWGVALLAIIIVLVLSFFYEDKFRYSSLVVLALVAWRFILLVRLYYLSRHNAKVLQIINESPAFNEELMAKAEALLRNYNTCRISADATPQSIMQTWLDANERGRLEGFHPVLLEIDDNLVDSLAEVINDVDSFGQRQNMLLNDSLIDAKEFLRLELEDLKESYVSDGGLEEWEENVVGLDLQFEALHDFNFNCENILLVEVPVQQPWQIFAYIPFGGWNGCPEDAEHMAVAKYWHEKYDAVVAHISSDTLEYYVPQPVSVDTMSLAEEQMGYCPDILQNDINLTTLARMNQASNVWSFWWD